MLLNSFYDTIIILRLKLDKDIMKKEDILISLMNIDSETLVEHLQKKKKFSNVSEGHHDAS